MRLATCISLVSGCGREARGRSSGCHCANFPIRWWNWRPSLAREVSELRDRLGEAPSDDARLDLIESWLRKRMRSRTPPTRAVSHAVEIIQRGADVVRIGRLADEIGISHKHLLREFERCVGLTPKVLARVYSFQRVIYSVGQRPEVNWAETAARCGYYDQAHLIREFRAFSGLTPSAYLSKRGPFLNYLEV